GCEVVVLGVDVDVVDDDDVEDGTRRITGVRRVVELLTGFSGRAAAWSVTAPEMDSGNRVATDGWMCPAGPVPKAVRTFMVTRVTTSVTHGSTKISHCRASFEI